MLADEEGEVRLFGEGKVRRERGVQPVERAARRPMVRRCVFLQPGARRGENERAAGADECGQTLEQQLRGGETAEEIGGVDEVEGAEVIAQMHGVALFKADALRSAVRRTA